jgi:hypothetical protein
MHNSRRENNLLRLQETATISQGRSSMANTRFGREKAASTKATQGSGQENCENSETEGAARLPVIRQNPKEPVSELLLLGLRPEIAEPDAGTRTGRPRRALGGTMGHPRDRAIKDSSAALKVTVGFEDRETRRSRNQWNVFQLVPDNTLRSRF